MKVAVYGTKPYDKRFLNLKNKSYRHELKYFEAHLNSLTAPLANGIPAVCVFVNDTLDAKTLSVLAHGGTSIIALRCAGFNNVDLDAAHSLRMSVVRVPAYSPHGVAEHAVALILALNRKIHRAYNRIREGNFLLEGLLGFDLCSKTVGTVGTGRIGAVFSRIMLGFGCIVLAHDSYPSEECRKMGVRYVELNQLFKASDIISLHCPLTPGTRHLIDKEAVSRMKKGVMLINTSRGALVDTRSVIQGLKSGKIGYLGLDVYEEEGDLFFEDLSNQVIGDDVFTRLLTFPNVLVTGHQAFFTSNALENIAETTLSNISDLERSQPCPNLVRDE